MEGEAIRSGAPPEMDQEDENDVRQQMHTPHLPEENTMYWDCLEELVSSHEIVVERKKGTAYPNHRAYPLDYGYLKDTTAVDGGGVDIFVGSLTDNTIQGILCTIDSLKNDAEIKILYNCTEAEVETAVRFMNGSFMRAIFVRYGRSERLE